MIVIDDVLAAAERLRDVVVRTPLLRNQALDDRVGGTVLLKPELWQSVGSFKIRGAYNLMRQLPEDVAKSGVVAWSSGNHAQGVAMAGRLLGIRTTIVMPADAPAAKLDNTRRLGGDIVTYDRYTENREAIARRIAEETDAALAPSFDHLDIIAGQGTVGLEIADEALQLGLDVNQALIPCGGGGLSSGCAIALRDRFPGAVVHTVEPEHYDDTATSLERGERVSVPQATASLCDALLANTPGQLTFEILRQQAGHGLVVTDAEVRHAMRFAFQHLKLVVEPGGAAGLAALLAGKVDAAGRTTAIVLSGGNVDPTLFASIQAEPS